MSTKDSVGINDVVKVVIEENKFINLDIGCGNNKQVNFVGMDKRPLEGVDIVHDLEVFPYPIEDNVCNTIVGSHIIEHIKPWLMIDLMNELWRILRVGGKVAFSLPYALSYGFVQDPTHCNPCNETTWEYFDPNCYMYRIYQPKPFCIEHRSWNAEGFMEVVLAKITEEEGAKRFSDQLAKASGQVTA
jgi:hypothetical protein